MEHKQVVKPKYECLLFDVDDTLYPLSSGLSEQCTKNIIEYMINELGIEEHGVTEICAHLYKEYGTTMAGLKAIGYDFDYDDYHSFVHGRLPYEYLKPDPVLKSLLQSLPIRKIIFSNANEEHVAEVLRRLGLEECFEGVICFETLNPINQISDDIVNDSDFKESKPSTILENKTDCNAVLPSKTPIVCKPSEFSFEQALKIANINPHKTLFFDDSFRNLQTGKLMGLHTVWVGASRRAKGADYAIESIHNIREALPELWEAVENKIDGFRYEGKVPIETSVRA